MGTAQGQHSAVKQELALARDKLQATEAELADSAAAVQRQHAQVASLKDQLLTLGDHCTATAKKNTGQNQEVGVVPGFVCVLLLTSVSSLSV